MLGLRSLLQRKPDPDAFELDHEGATLRVRLRRRPNARRLTLRVSSATGDVVLTLPPRASLGSARSFALRHGGWIAARLANVPVRVPFEPGRQVPLRGSLHEIVLVPGRGATRVGEGDAPTIAVSCEAPRVPRRVRDFLAGQARSDLLAAVARYGARVGREPKRITLRDTRSRWGSCTAGGELNFSWRLILAPPFVLDYLVAHEMAHLRELNHSPRFWAHLEAICPHVEEAELWLKRHGADLHRYG